MRAELRARPQFPHLLMRQEENRHASAGDLNITGPRGSDNVTGKYHFELILWARFQI
jgi:hypothetical protein